MAINSRTKGNKEERNVAKLMKAWTGKDFARVPSSGGLQWKNAHAKGDIVCSDEKTYFPFCIEVKSYKELNFQHLLYLENPKIIEFWEQCIRDAKLCNKIPLLIMRYNGLPKEFYFIILEQQFYSYCVEPFYNKNDKAFELSGKYNLCIIPSNRLFDIPYSRVKRLFKNYAENLEEIIKPVKGYSERYSISNRGYIIDNKTKAIKYGSLNGEGIRNVTLSKGLIWGKKKKKTFALYRLIAKHFVKNPKPQKYNIINHIKPVKGISDARNLEWTTSKRNSQHHWDNIDLGYRINQIDIITGELISTFNTPIKAAKSLGKNFGSTISKCLNGKRATAYGFKWTKSTQL